MEKKMHVTTGLPLGLSLGAACAGIIRIYCCSSRVAYSSSGHTSAYVDGYESYKNTTFVDSRCSSTINVCN